MVEAKYIQRKVNPVGVSTLQSAGFSPLVARLLSARGITDALDMDVGMAQLLKPGDLKGAKEAGELLADAIDAGKKICIVADYDCDGASACAVSVRGLNLLGAKTGTVSYLVPDRQRDGFGLTSIIVDRAIEQQQPDVIMTVDNGIASIEGVAHAIEKGLKVLVTDHHLPAVIDDKVVLPAATVTVNPSQPDCEFASKALCGAGVAFYVMLTTRAALRARGRFDAQTQPRLDALLDLVALATVADVVKMDANNRRLVANGLDRMRSGRCHEGILALFGVAGRDHRSATSTDLGFTLGPRINAAGRMADMRIGIQCLLEDDRKLATELASTLHKINTERRAVEANVSEHADEIVAKLKLSGDDAAIVVHDPGYHEGVVGIVAGRTKERENRPTFVFANAHDGGLKGSGRSIPGFHLRDALDLVSKRKPGLILKFGGHSMAAGCTIRSDGLEEFRQSLSAISREWLTPEMLQRVVATDGSLGKDECTVTAARDIANQVWGQGFDAPIFVDDARVIAQRIVGLKHMKLSLKVHGQNRDGIWFGRKDPLPDEATLAYRVSVNAWQGRETVQMVVEGMVAK